MDHSLSPRTLGAAALLVLAALTGCGRQAPQPYEEPPRPVRSMTVAAGAVVSQWSLAGEVKPRVEVRYGFRVGGRVVERKVEVGDRVEQGQLLARLDPQDLTPALDASGRSRRPCARSSRWLGPISRGRKTCARAIS
jgi:multidrug efflux pump subunit AcrA (membrane-fusion protein)